MPNNWKTYKLGDLISYQKGFAFKSDWFKYKGDLVVRVSDTTSNSIDISSCHRIDKDKSIELQKYKLEKDDIVIATVGSWPPNYASVVGKVIKVPIEADGALLNQNAVRLKSIDDSLHSKKYIYYLMKSEYFLRYIVNTAQGSANQASIKLTDIFDFKFDIPEFQEQQSIASILSTIDDKIENNLAINKTLEEMAMALYKHWFVDFGPFQNGEFDESELGLIPKGWEKGKLEDLLEIKYGKDHKKLLDGKIPVYGSGGIMRYANEALYDKESILIPRKGTLSNLFYVSQPFWSVDTMFYSKFKDANFGKYTFYFLKSIDLASMDVGSAIPSLTTELLKKIEVLIPPKEIVYEFNKIVNSKFNILESNIKENQSLTQLRDTLLSKLISGEVRLKEFRES